MSKNPCFALKEAGTAVWLDQLSRDMLKQGRLESLISTVALSGVTSNPAIFEKAMSRGTAYDDQLAELRERGLETEEIYENLAVRDIQMACDVLRPVYEETGGADGFVSLEVSPHLARNAEGSLEAARRLYGWVDRPNVLIKIPGTPEGLSAIERALAEGIGVNITLLFAVDAYEAVAGAYVRALQTRRSAGQPLHVPSVASFFVSRIDSLVDEKLEDRAGKAGSEDERDGILSLRGTIAIANAKLAYQSFLRIFGTPAWKELEAAGARVQRPLWASTSTKNPEYRDVLYVEPLVGRHTVNTMPESTLEATCDHATIRPDTVLEGIDDARSRLRRLEEAGISFREVTDRLLEEAIDKFVTPYDALLESLEKKRNG